MTTRSRRSRLPLHDPQVWRSLIVLFALVCVLGFGTLNCWLFLSYGQQQLLGQVLAGLATLVTGLLGGAGAWNLWARLKDDEKQEK